MIIVTKNPTYLQKGCIVVNSIEEAIREAERNNQKEVFIIGGGEIFKQSIVIANKIYLTNVHTNTDADVFFPKIDKSSWKMIWSEEIAQDEKDKYESDYKILVRNN